MSISTARCLALFVAVFVFTSTGGAQRLAPPPTSAPSAAPRDANGILNALLWVQTSAEYHFLCEGAYAAAGDALDKALNDPTWTAVLEQTGDFSALPPAVILDVDETVLEHSAYQAEMLKRGVSPSSRAWHECVDKYCMPAVPGAIEFIKHARSRGVTVFFVTNREVDLESGTRRNLVQLGVDMPASPDTILVAGEQPGWTSDKSSRRAYLAKSYRILLQCGDDFGDFLAGANNTPARRLETADAHHEMWGRRWFLVPNPLTGSWTSAAMSGAGRMTDAESLDYRRAMLRGYDAMPLLPAK